MPVGDTAPPATVLGWMRPPERDHQALATLSSRMPTTGVLPAPSC